MTGQPRFALLSFVFATSGFVACDGGGTPGVGDSVTTSGSGSNQTPSSVAPTSGTGGGLTNTSAPTDSTATSPSTAPTSTVPVDVGPTSSSDVGSSSDEGPSSATPTTTTTSGPNSDDTGVDSSEGPTSEPSPVGFSLPSGTFRPPLTLEATGPGEGEIRVTVDGTPPTIDSPLYSGALELTQTTQVRAQLFVDGMPQGSSTTGLFVARDFEATSNIPILVVDGYRGGKPTDKETYHDAAFMLFEPVDGVADISAAPTVVSRSGYRLRGQSSQSFAQTPYRVELWGEDDVDFDQPLAGMPAEADWGLLGPYVDRSLVRNPFVYTLGQAMGLEAPNTAWVEVYINHDAPVLSSTHYEGVYWLTELIKNAKNRLDLKSLNEGDTALPALSGGYIFSFEYRSVEGTPIPCTGDDIFFRRITGGLSPNTTPPTTGFCWTDLELREPKLPNTAQLDYITQYLHDFHATLHEQPLGDWGAYADKASFVDHFIIAEFTRNMDAYNKSAYFYKDRDGLLTAGPLWDYNLALGMGGYFDNMETAGWQLDYRLHTTDWFLALAENPEFMTLVSARWKELRMGLMSDEALLARLDAMTAPLAQAAVRDFERWPVASISSLFELPPGATWEAQLEALRSWMTARAAWLDTAVDQPIDVEDYPLAE